MDARQLLFQYRSYTPFPFLLAMLFFAHPTLISFIAGIPVILAGEYFRLWGVSIAGSETRTTGPVGGTFLITTGPFAYVRNPLYVGNILIYCGVGIISHALFPWLLVVAFLFFVIQYHLIVSIEENYLRQTFGEEYERYCASVPRFVLKLNRYNPGNNPQPELDWKRGLISEKRTLQAIVLIFITVIILWWVRA